MISRSILSTRLSIRRSIINPISSCPRTYATVRQTHPAQTRSSILGLPLSIPFLGRLPDIDNETIKMSTSSTSKPQGLQVYPVQARSDNWMYRKLRDASSTKSGCSPFSYLGSVLVDSTSNEAAVVDPYDWKAMWSAVKEKGVKVTTLLTTHHHDDHSGGNVQFVSCPSPIFGA